MSHPDKPKRKPAKRVRLSRPERYRQLIEIAWRLAREEGTDALTLPRLAEESDISKPVVYDHFSTRNGLLTALYQDFDEHQTALIDAALEACAPTLEETAQVIARSYVNCVLTQGREIPGVLAGLAGSPELEAVKREYQLAFIEKCRRVLAPYTGLKPITQAGFWAMLGAADALSHAAATGGITVEQAETELYETIINMIARSHP